MKALSGDHECGHLGKLHHIANVDQTPLPLCFTDGPTYADKEEVSMGARRSIRTREGAIYNPACNLCRWEAKDKAISNFPWKRATNRETAVRQKKELLSLRRQCLARRESYEWMGPAPVETNLGRTNASDSRCA